LQYIKYYNFLNYNKKGISLIDDGAKKAITQEHQNKIQTNQAQKFYLKENTKISHLSKFTQQKK